jgi:hypothetical protein
MKVLIEALHKLYDARPLAAELLLSAGRLESDAQSYSQPGDAGSMLRRGQDRFNQWAYFDPNAPIR